MKIYHIALHQDDSLEKAWEELDISGIEVLYGDEDPEVGTKIIVCRLSEKNNPKDLAAKWPFIQSIEEAPDLTIDWEAQWSTHGSDFHDGLVHVKVGINEIRLKPGPGFGDASHPSTRLVLQLMEKEVAKRAVLDVGCGSGVLSIAASALNAESVYSIDIDADAIRHTLENIELNQVDCFLWVGSAEELVEQKPKKKMIALMNMISSEQELAWNSLIPLHENIEEWITSGILAEEKEAYAALWKNRGWTQKNVIQEDDWLAFHFTK